MINVSHFGKMGDLVYALPVMRALARRSGERIYLTTSALCFGLVPLLWEQPYIEDVEIDGSKPYKMSDGVMSGWDYYQRGEGINLSPQPSFYRPDAPIPWTDCYMETAGVRQLEPTDFVAFPSLVNHRRWHFSATIKFDGKVEERRKRIVIAPESESLEQESPQFWEKLIDNIPGEYAVILLGKKSLGTFSAVDLRGLTTVPTMARIIAEADGFIGVHSLPWHIARHSETPAVCIQKWSKGLQRCIPIDTDYNWIEPENWKDAIDFLQHGAQTKWPLQARC